MDPITGEKMATTVQNTAMTAGTIGVLIFLGIILLVILFYFLFFKHIFSPDMQAWGIAFAVLSTITLASFSGVQIQTLLKARGAVNVSNYNAVRIANDISITFTTDKPVYASLIYRKAGSLDDFLAVVPLQGSQKTKQHELLIASPQSVKIELFLVLDGKNYPSNNIPLIVE